MPEPTVDPPGWIPELNVRTRSSDLTLRGDCGYRVGRDPNAALVLNDGRVSWQHALLRLVGGMWVLEDTDSTNGTWVAGQRISRIEIRGLLVVRFGGPHDGVAVRLQPKPRAPRAPEALAAQMLPFILAALRADGDTVLARPRESLISAVTFGRAWLQEIFGRRAEGEPLPPVLAEAIGKPGNADSRAALSAAIRAALVKNEWLAWAAAYAMDTRPDLGSAAQPQDVRAIGGLLPWDHCPMTSAVQPPEETFCLDCGPDAALERHGSAMLRCPRCGAGQRIPALPLFVVTGASGAGKTTVTGLLRSRLPDCDVFEVDATLQVAALGWEVWRDTWLRVVHEVALNGRVSVLCGSLQPDQLEHLPARRLVGPVHCCVLDCPDAVRARRLRARPSWRGTSTEAAIAEHQRYAAWLRANIGPCFDTSLLTPARAADQVAAWVRRQLQAGPGQRRD